MSSYPSPTPTHPPYGRYEPPANNGMGIAGFIVSLIGLFVCAGVVCPIGLLLSLVALRKEPRGFAIAGLIIGLIGSLMGVFVVLIFVGIIGAGNSFFQAFTGQFQTMSNIDSAHYDIDFYYFDNNSTLPDTPTGNQIVSQYYDHWGNPLQYRPVAGTADQYEILSAGEDQQFGTSDDIIQTYFATIGGGFGNTAQNNPLGENDANDTQIDYAFDQAAQRIVATPASPTGLPTEADGNNALSGVRDAWGGEIRYAPSPYPPLYHLKSAGPDGNWKTGDDIDRSFQYGTDNF